MADHLRTADCLFNDAQLPIAQKRAQEGEECRLEGIRTSEASNSTRPQVRQHASNKWAEDGGVKQAHKSKVGQRLTI